MSDSSKNKKHDKTEIIAVYRIIKDGADKNVYTQAAERLINKWSVGFLLKF